MDLKQHLIRQMAFSHATFGPGNRWEGIVDQIKKEIIELEESGGECEEWVDIVILALDGLTRSLAFSLGNGLRQNPNIASQTAINMIAAKQTENESRQWPDWRTADKNKSMENIK